MGRERLHASDGSPGRVRPRAAPGRAAGTGAVKLLCAALLMGGCTGSPSATGTGGLPSSSATASESPSAGATTPGPSPTATDPKSVAYARATAAYDRFRTVLDQVTADGGKRPERLDAVATGFGLQQAKATASLYRDRGWRAVALTTLITETPRSFSSLKNAHLRVQIVSCDDTRTAKVVDSSGNLVPKRGNITFIITSVTVVTVTDKIQGDWLVERFTNKKVKACAR